MYIELIYKFIGGYFIMKLLNNKKLIFLLLCSMIIVFINSCRNIEPQQKDYDISIIPPYPQDEFEPNPEVYDIILSNLYSALNRIKERNTGKHKFIPHYPTRWRGQSMISSNNYQWCPVRFLHVLRVIFFTIDIIPIYC